MAIRFRSALPGALCLGLLTTAAFAQTTPVELPLGPVESVQTVETEPFAPVEESSGSIADGIRLDEAIRPLAGYFQVGGAAGATGGAKPKYPLINVSGAAQIDAVWFNQDAANEAVLGDAQDVAGFRRSRLGVNGNLAENVAYRMEYDFAFPGRPNFTDVWADLSDLPVGHFRAGQWKQPFSMEAATSFRELMFMERSLSAAMIPFRQIGAGFWNVFLDDAATYAISGYRFSTDAFGNVAGDAGYGMSTRETLVLWHNDCGDTIVIGGNYSYNEPAAATFQVRSTPEVGFTQANLPTTVPIPFFADAGAQPTDSYQLAGAEFAAGIGSLLFQSEMIYGNLDRTGASNLSLPAGYAQLGYVLTGERRNYLPNSAAYSRVIHDAPFGRGGPGAWELAGRYSMIDLNDDDVQGGRLQDLTAGVNWFLNRYTRWEFNYIHPILDRPVGNETEADIFATRVQFDF